MPLETQIRRGGKRLQLRWGGFHIAAMVIAVAADSGQGPWEDNSLTAIYRGAAPSPAPVTRGMAFQLADYLVIGSTPLNDGEYVLKHDYAFVDTSDGEVLQLRVGDVLSAWRTA